MASSSRPPYRKTRANKPKRPSDFPEMSENEENTFQGRGGSSMPKLRMATTAYVELDDFEGTNIRELLDFQGWLDYVGREFIIHPEYVRWFYMYFRPEVEDRTRYKIEVICGDGSRLVFDQDDFRADFGLIGTYGGFKNYKCEGWQQYLQHLRLHSTEDIILHLNNAAIRPEVTEAMASATTMEFLTGDDKLLLKIIREVLFPSNNKDNKVTQFQELILVMIKNRVRINLPVLMLSHMQAALTNRRAQTLPYGGLVTHIMRRWNIGPLRQVQPEQPLVICKRTYIKQGSILLGSRLVQDWEAPFLQPEDRAAYDILLLDRERRRQRARGAQGGVQPRGGGQARQAQQEQEEVDPQEGPSVAHDDESPRRRSSAHEPSDSIALRLSNLEARQRTQERRQGRMMRLMRQIAVACGCHADDVEAFDRSSPDE